MNPWGPGPIDPGLLDPPLGGGLADPHSPLRQLLDGLHQLCLRVQALRAALEPMAPAPANPLPLHIEHLTVEKLEFHFDGIEVDQLSGQMNIGITGVLEPKGISPRQRQSQGPSEKEEGDVRQ